MIANLVPDTRPFRRLSVFQLYVLESVAPGFCLRSKSWAGDRLCRTRSFVIGVCRPCMPPFGLVQSLRPLQRADSTGHVALLVLGRRRRSSTAPRQLGRVANRVFPNATDWQSAVKGTIGAPPRRALFTTPALGTWRYLASVVGLIGKRVKKPYLCNAETIGPFASSRATASGHRSADPIAVPCEPPQVIDYPSRACMLVVSEANIVSRCDGEP